MFSEFQGYWPKVHINMCLRHVVITIQAADGRSYILPNPSLLAFTVISPYHPSVAGWNDKTTTSIIQWEKPTEKLVNDKQSCLRGRMTVLGMSFVYRLYSLGYTSTLPPSYPPIHSLTHSLTHSSNRRTFITTSPALFAKLKLQIFTVRGQFSRTCFQLIQLLYP